MNTTLFELSLILAIFLCSIVAGFLFAFAVVVMPGINRLHDRDFIRAFQVIDGVIQDNQPLFLLVWVGSVVALATTAGFSIWQLSGSERLLVIAAALAYLLGVQLPTAAINIPLNNKLKTLVVDNMDAAMQRRARDEFEPRWNQWNAIRTVVASLTSIVLLFVLAPLP
jgi:uncharacterized membrane protein